MASIKQDASLLIVGGGTWGCSIALDLARRGYTNITVLDGHSFPSAIAAGNDLNKIMEEPANPSPEDCDRDYFFNRISQLSSQAWRRDPIYSPFYHPTGFIMSACSPSFYEEQVAPYAKEFPHAVLLETAEQWRATMPKGVFTGQFPGWRGVYRQTGAGWVFARGAIEAVHAEAIRLGVKFVTANAGAVTSLLFTHDHTDIRGAVTADGRTHYADTTILSAGANSDLLLDFKKQLRPTAWTLAHIPLSSSEAHIYKDMPVPYNVERGFFIEPDAETHQIKICDEHPGYLRMVTDPNTGEKRSVPFAKHQIPVEAEARIRRLLRDTMPQLAEREFSFARICWDADTADRVFLIDRHPDFPSLMLACGGSGHGVNPMPAIGKVVADRMEGKMEERLQKMARWRPEQAVDRDWWDLQGRHGADEKVMELANVTGWTRIGENMSEKL